MISQKNYMNFPNIDIPLLEIFSKTSIQNLLALHIETTGFSWKKSIVFLIGFMKMDAESGQWFLEQWLLNDPAMEKELLIKFSNRIKENTCLLHYNGSQFDLPFLEKRCKLQGIPVTWQDCGQLDLYQTLRPCQKLFGLDRMRLCDLEKYLGIPRPDGPSGKKYISTFQAYTAEKRPALEKTLFLHNQWNLSGLLQCASALAYPALFQGNFQLELSRIVQDSLTCHLRLQATLPKPFSLDYSPKPWVVAGSDRQAQATFPLENGCLRMYYPNYKDYYYLPTEDMAIHKSVGAYVDKKNRTQATKENCFTRFPCTIDFMQNRRQIEDYIRHCLLL